MKTYALGMLSPESVIRTALLHTDALARTKNPERDGFLLRFTPFFFLILNTIYSCDNYTKYEYREGQR